MVVSIIISALLAILVIFLLAKLNQRSRQIEMLTKQERRQWLLKVALEQSCQVPTVEADELEPVAAEINRLMETVDKDKSAEEKIRSIIMGLYEEKVKGKKADAKAAKAAPQHEAAPHHDAASFHNPAPHHDTIPRNDTGHNPRSINNK
jgi:hypothetical protein